MLLAIGFSGKAFLTMRTRIGDIFMKCFDMLRMNAGHGYNICTECLQASCESSGGNQVGPFSEIFWHIDSKKISFLQIETFGGGQNFSLESISHRSCTARCPF